VCRFSTNAKWNPRDFDFDRDLATAGRKIGFIDANDPDLTRFERSKGKL
jgi:hypothetical protein